MSEHGDLITEDNWTLWSMNLIWQVPVLLKLNLTKFSMIAYPIKAYIAN